MTIDIGMPQPYNVSNSEASTWLSCRRMYVFAHGLVLAPKNLAPQLQRGTLGHLYFQYYVEARLNGLPHTESMSFAQKAFKEAIADGAMSIELVMETQFLTERYMNFHQGWPYWKLLGTEQRKDLKLTETLNLPIRYDLYVQDIRTGKYAIVDYKFTYDFWRPEDHDVNAQMPKYIATMKANGFPVDMGYLEEIRTRPLGAEKSSDERNLWRRTPYNPTKARTRSMLKQHIAASMEIETFRNENPSNEDKLNSAIALYNKHGACKFCNFHGLCNSVTEGKTDLSVDIRTDYTTNTYGYNGMAADELI